MGPEDEEYQTIAKAKINTVKKKRNTSIFCNLDLVILFVLLGTFIYCCLQLYVFQKIDRDGSNDDMLYYQHLKYSALKPTFQKISLEAMNNNQNITFKPKLTKIMEMIEQISNDRDLTNEEKKQKIRQLKRTKKIEMAKIKTHLTKIDSFIQKSQFQNLHSLRFVQYNMRYNDTEQYLQIQRKLQEQQERIFKLRYNIDKYQQLPMCIIVYADNNDKQNSYEYVFTSIFNQHYNNYKVVFVADGFSKNQMDEVKQFIQQHNLTQYVSFVDSIIKEGYIKHITKASKNLCGNAEAIAVINANDELINHFLFRIYSAVFQKTAANLVYSNYIDYNIVSNQVLLGSSNRYSNVQIEQNKFREADFKFGPLLAFRPVILESIQLSHFKDKYQDYLSHYKIIFNELSLQLLELSCGRIQFVQQYSYLAYIYPKSQIEDHEKVMNDGLRQLQHLNCYKYQQI